MRLNTLTKKLSFLFLLPLCFLFSSPLVFAQTVSNIEIVPALDISVFAPYKIKANVSGSPISITAQIQLLNADGTTH